MESEADHSFADFASIDSASVGSASVASMDDGEAENNPYIKEYMDRVGSLVETENIDNNTILITPSEEASLDKAPAIAFSLKEKHADVVSHAVVRRSPSLQQVSM